MPFSKGETNACHAADRCTVCMNWRQVFLPSMLKLSYCSCRGISTISEHNKVKTRPGLHSRLSEKAMDVLQDPSRTASAEVTADGSIPSNHIAASLDALESATGVLHQGPHATMRQHQTVRLHKRSKAPEPLPMVQHKHMLASATYTTNPYRRAHQAPLLSGGRTSPTPFSAHLSAQMPGRVLPLLNEVSTGYCRKLNWRKLSHC